ncbi:MAG TPA: hypothetical protein VKV15_19880 [Bryobacteraceae bacterium]|nr:hypothetical protein [Bryobacteraceae bacterium]
MDWQVTRLLVFLCFCLTADASDKVVESVVSALDSGPSCSSSVALQNLGDRPVTVAMEAHKASGALVPFVGHPAIAVLLEAGERLRYKLALEDGSAGAWVMVRETILAPGVSPVVAVSGTTECVTGNQLRTAGRDVAYPSRNPWFSGDVAELPGGVVSLINATDQAARASACYSSGVFYSGPHPSTELTPVCSTVLDVQVPPFGSRRFPVEREGNSHFSLKTAGSAIVLQMLRPVPANVRMYRVDSTIQFGSEVPQSK